MKGKKEIWICLLMVAQFLITHAQVNKNILYTNLPKNFPDSTAKIFIKDIIIKGNKLTKSYIILREMQFKNNDSLVIASLFTELDQAQKQVYNIALFSDVQFQIQFVSAVDIIVIVAVKERWYIYPIPEFKLVDRNFNEWAKTYNYSLSRVNYGIKFSDFNLTGHKDELDIYLLSGFSHDFSFSYKAPYFNNKLTKGFTISAGYSQKKQIAYNTTYNDSLLYFISDSLQNKFVGSIFYVNAGYTIRKGFFSKQIFKLGFSRINISDSILLPQNNPNYFAANKTTANIVELSYSFRYLNVNNVSYATTGVAANVTLTKTGLGFSGGINAFTLETGYNKYNSLGKNWFTSIQIYGKLRLPFQEAFINQQALGYGDNYLRGLEYKVINGVATTYLKTTLKYKLVQFKIPLPFKIKSEAFLPFAIYAKTYADVGYVFNKQEFLTSLNNKFLYSGGFGIDIISIYDVNLRLEYSYNQLGQKGLFLHSQSGF